MGLGVCPAWDGDGGSTTVPLMCGKAAHTMPSPGNPVGRLGAPMAFRHIQGRMDEELREGQSKKIKRRKDFS